MKVRTPACPSLVMGCRLFLTGQWWGTSHINSKRAGQKYKWEPNSKLYRGNIANQAVHYLTDLMGVSCKGIVISVLPGLFALGLFYSLAFHMHHSLGGWPTSIGERGFPPALLIHATVATSYFWILILLSIFILPVAILVCLLVSRWRHFVLYFVLYAFVFVVSIVLMQLAPEPFLYWWRD